MTEAKSAKEPGIRPVFAQMIARIQAGEAEGIMCWHLNRLFRNNVDYGQVSWLLQQGTIKSIRTVEREYLPDDNVLLMAVEAGVATQYIIDLRKAVTRGLYSKAAKGWFPGQAPPGYANNPLSRQIDVNRKLFPLLRRAWELLLTNTVTIPQLLEQLTAWGMPPLARSGVYRLFSNPFYYGYFLFKGILYEGQHRPMVTKDEFDRVQQILHKPNHIQPQKHEFAFTGLIRCAACGCLVTAERRVKTYPRTGNTRVYIYYHCSGSKGCSKAGIRQEEIEQQIQTVLELGRIDERLATLFLEFADRYDSEQPGSFARIREQQRLALVQSRHRLERLLELRLTGEIEADEYKTHRNRLQEEIARLEGQRTKMAAQTSHAKQVLESGIAFATAAYRDFAEGTVKTKRAIATALSSNYILNLGTLSFKRHPLLDRFRAFELPKGPRNMVQQGPFVPSDPIWCSILDNIRTSIIEEGLDFVYQDPSKVAEPPASPTLKKTP